MCNGRTYLTTLILCDLSTISTFSVKNFEFFQAFSNKSKYISRIIEPHTHILVLGLFAGAASRDGGGRERVSKKGQMRNYWVIHATKGTENKSSCFSSLIRKYMLLKGFYHNLALKSVSFRGLCPSLTPHHGALQPGPPSSHCPLTIYPSAA